MEKQRILSESLNFPKKILYVHGFNSSGSTGRFLKEFFKDYEVFAPTIPEKFDEAKNFVEKFINDNKIDLVIGTSLGAFVTLNIQNKVKRIIINPTFNPYNDLQLINASEDIYKSYKGHSIYDEEVNNITPYKFKNTYGIFGDSDPLFSYYKDFQNIFNNNQTFKIPNMEHQIKPNEIEKYLKPMVDYLMTFNF